LFSPEKHLKEIIVDEISEEALSISGLVRKLKTRGISIHRLVLTGYLKSTDRHGHHKRKGSAPLKIYIPVGPRELNIYEAIANACEEHMFDHRRGTAAAVYTLQFLFHRPVFKRELTQIENDRDAGASHRASCDCG